MSKISLKWNNMMVDGLLRSFSYIVGVEQLKMFVSKAGEAIMAMAEDNGAAPISGSIIAEIIQATGESIKSLDPGELVWDVEITGDEAKLAIGACPYSELCSSMIGEIISSGRIEKKKLPCIMSELASGSCHNCGIKTRATLESFAPGFKCVSKITKVVV